ncbi:MAG: asparagine synthase (glutamine-hydrolyzing) [Candidatus Eremiobacteraeota bacterium]|nr:asparagine synthase (glutamine-hydrolyzing) [Candidatus Eremiobacteraeota bacterium]
MCGIVGLYQTGVGLTQEETRFRVETMRDSLRHRGPDDAGTWLEPNGRLAMGHRRLAILDLSPEGHQPMASRDGRYQLVYNGEVYNFLELRRQLEQFGHHFNGSSDTEVLLAAFCQWGLENTLPRLNGMFALALWDARAQRLALARDRYGKKPLYYGLVGEAWAFASELKALKTLPEFDSSVNRAALGEYFRLGYVPAPLSIYQGIHKLPPASFCWLPESPKPYWTLGATARSNQPTSLEQIEQALLTAVKLRMASDVPLGAFLSGGIDSSLIVAMMQEQSDQPVRTFSLGFHSATHDEAIYARKVAEHLGTQHVEHYVTATEALDVVPHLPRFYDEPFADSSQIATYLVSKLARTQVTVALSGDGGDEVFGGYNRYLFAPQVWRWLRVLPLSLRKILSALVNRLPLSLLEPLLAGRVSYPKEKLTKLAHLLPCRDEAEIYRSLISQWQEPRSVVIGAAPPIPEKPINGDFVHWMMIRDAQTYLPDDILVKVDRASMAVSLEARAPLLDPTVTDLAWRLPREQKIEGREGKRILRKLLYKRVPSSLFQRPKAGFSLPLGDWLRVELRDWVETMLETVSKDGYLRVEPVRRIWREHTSGYRDRSAALWTVLMFQAWMREAR